MIQTIQFVILGSVLGLTAGIAPGPLLTLVLTQTIKYNRAEGIKIAISPLITDLPIILVTLLIFYKLSQFNTILGIISFTGGVFIAFLGYESIRSKGLVIENRNFKSTSLKKGIVTNFLNPQPYLFWATIGSPYIFKAYEINLITLIMFLASFYALLVGSKVAVAVMVSRSKIFMGQKSYIIIIKILGIILFVFSILLFYEGIQYLRLN